MNYQHEVDPRWMEARRCVITATELVSLIPSYKKSLKSKAIMQPKFAALWAKKQATHPEDVMSYGAAARGHIMEPYAVDDWNRNYVGAGVTMYHWDDCIICNGGVGFSPDAMDVMMPNGVVKADVRGGRIIYENGLEGDMPTQILEIKSYELAHHYENMFVDKMDKELEKERMQIAVAMMVLPTIEKARLVQYNPKAQHGMYEFVYTRNDLEKDIRLLENVLDMWLAHCRKLEAIPSQLEVIHTEDEIHDAWEGEWMKNNGVLDFGGL